MTEARGPRGWLSDLLAVAFVLFVALLLLLLAPGMLTVYVMRVCLNLQLDPGQMWSFSVVAALAIFLVCRQACGAWRHAFVTYLLLCGLATGGPALCRFGFHCRWPGAALRTFLPRDAQPPPVSSSPAVEPSAPGVDPAPDAGTTPDAGLRTAQLRPLASVPRCANCPSPVASAR